MFHLSPSPTLMIEVNDLNEARIIWTQRIIVLKAPVDGLENQSISSAYSQFRGLSPCVIYSIIQLLTQNGHIYVYLSLCVRKA